MVEKKSSTEELITEARSFFDSYKKEMAPSIKAGKNVINVSFKELSMSSPLLSEKMINNPEDTLMILETALEESGLVSTPRVRIFEFEKVNDVLIRNLRAKHLNQLLQVEGLVRQSSEVRPQVVNAKFECPSCGALISVLQIERKFREPSRCSCGRKTSFRLIAKDMVDAQRIVIEESPDSLTGGEQPRRMQIFLKEDLVEPKMEEKTTPGSKVSIVGVLKEVPVPLPTGSIQTRFDLAIEANNIIPLEESFEELDINEEDERQIQELAADPNLFQKLIGSIAPSVWGYEEVKQALIYQLFGGVKKTRSDGTKTRGDIHVLLVGDPGVAKSVILKFISGIAPKGRYVSGKSASGAGLTASVVRDEFMRGWSLEAGAMVLSNKGLVAIDELEKMDPEDRSAMHESLEQQSVTISKANIHATLKAETSVLAAANPKFGRFDPFQPVPMQIDLPPTLINRFDVVFVLRDLPDRAKDEAIATHVLMEHKQQGEGQLIESYLFRKYIAYAKQKIHPALTDSAVDEIKKFYVELRNMPVAGGEELVKPIPISARQLEALIRMSEACAKARLSKKVTKEDAKKSIALMKYYLMQVGYDYESKTFDIDRIVTGVTTSQRGKIILVREALSRLESRLGKLIPIEELKKELQGKVEEKDIDDAIEKLSISGDVFHPRKGYLQRV